MNEKFSKCCWGHTFEELLHDSKTWKHTSYRNVCYVCGKPCETLTQEEVNRLARRDNEVLEKLEKKYGKGFWREDT